MMQSHNLHDCYDTGVSWDAKAFTMSELENDTQMIRALCDFADMRPSTLAAAVGVAATTITRPYNGTAKSQISNATLKLLKAKFPGFPGWPNQQPDIPPIAPELAYESIDILPTFAGMGGGGNGDGDKETALVPTYLIRQVLRGLPGDFVLVRVRGTSMEPMFRQDDELLIDKRDRSPTQPGPFCLWDAEWGEYVVKNVERLPGGRVRVFSENPQFTPYEVDNDQSQILGRPVWFGRRL